MLGPQHVPPLIKYFSGVDFYVAQKLMRKNPPDERSLTTEFCSCMDSEDQISEGMLNYDINMLNAELSKKGNPPRVTINIETHQHSQALESYVSQSDIGLILNFNNGFFPKQSWTKSYLLQAKRLFMGPEKRSYDSFSRFKSIDRQQSARIWALRRIIGFNRVKYFLYTPPANKVDAELSQKIEYLHTQNLAWNLYDYALGLAFHNWFQGCSGKINDGLWVVDDMEPNRKILELHRMSFVSALPLSWFIMQHVIGPACIGDIRRETPDVSEHYPDDAKLTEAIVRGDPSSLRDVAEKSSQYIGDKREAPENFKVFPANKIEIDVSVGYDLSSDTRQIKFDSR